MGPIKKRIIWLDIRKSRCKVGGLERTVVIERQKGDPIQVYRPSHAAVHNVDI